MRGRAVVVLHRVARTDDFGLFQTGNGVDERQLHLERQARGKAVDVVLVGVAAFRLQEELVPGFLREFDHLILDGRTIARANPFDAPAVHGRFVEIIADDGVGRFVGAGRPAGQLFHVEHAVAPFVEGEKIVRLAGQPFGPEREHRRRMVAGMQLALCEVDGAPVEAAGSTRLETRHLEAEFAQAVAERGHGVAHASAGLILQADVQQAAHERAGRDDHRACEQPDAERGVHAGDALLAVHQQTRDGPLVEIQALLIFERVLEAELISLLVTLRTRPAYARPLGRIEHTTLDGGGVSVESHRAAEGIDLTDHVPFRQPADCRVARHLADGVKVLREHGDFGTHPGGGKGGFDPGMTRADDQHVVSFRKGEHGKQKAMSRQER